MDWFSWDGWSSVMISVDAVVTGVKQGGVWDGWSSVTSLLMLWSQE